MTNHTETAPQAFSYSPWRHGGWYVHDVRYPTGACGCVSRNYADRKWRIVCDPRGFEERPTFKSRDEAARAEWELTRELWQNEKRTTMHEIGDIVQHDGEEWKILAIGAERDGKVYAHLASTTRVRQQPNGWYPYQIGDWIEPK